MEKQLINNLLGTITDIVSADGSWQSKRNEILAECGDDDRTMFEEFLAWFEPEQE